MTNRVLSTRALNRALLARQQLLRRSDAALTVVLEQVGGLQTQYAPSGYLGLWSRLEGFRRPDLTSALVERRAIQATVMRATIHLLSAADYWPFAAGTRRARLETWTRNVGEQIRPSDLESAAERAREHLAGGPLRHDELIRRLGADGVPRTWWYGVAQAVDLVRVPPSGTWEQRRANLYGLAETWLDPSPVGEGDGIVHLVRRYLGGFGPATRKDIASWAGLSVAAIGPALSELDLRRFRDERGRELLDLPDSPLPDPGTPAPVRFLPTWDANLLIHARRAAILPEPYRPRIFSTRTPHSFPTFLIDGAVAGTWRHDGTRVVLEPFEDLAATTRRELDDEAERLAAWHDDREAAGPART